MSRATGTSKRYAKALYEVAQDRGRVGEVEQDLLHLAETVRVNSDLRDLLEHPAIALEKKKAIIEALFQGKGGSEVYNLLLLLTDRRRTEIVPFLVVDYGKIANEALGQAVAVVTTPKPLTAEEAEAITTYFSRITGKKIRVSSEIDTSLLGGLQVRIGDRLYDGSLSGKLNRLRKTLVGSQAL